MTLIRKEFAVTRQGDFLVATTPTFDRANDRVFPMGGNLNNYRSNPVVMWGHNYSDPWAIIGRAEEIAVTSEGITFRPALRPAANDADPMAIIALLWDQDFVRTASIGFNPSEARPNERGGMDYTSWEMLEISIVGIPMNQDALRFGLTGAAAADDLISNWIVRAGRVLSRANEGKLREASTLLDSVLSQLESDDDSKAIENPPVGIDEQGVTVLSEYIKTLRSRLN